MKRNKIPNYPVPDVKDFRELAEYCAKNFANDVAFRWLNSKNEEEKVTYTRFYNDIKALSTYFINKGYSRAHIALVGENSYNWILTYFAVVNSNNIIVPIDKELMAPDMTKLLERSDSVAFVYSDDYAEEAEINANLTLFNMKNIPDYIAEGNKLIKEGNRSYDEVVVDNRALSAIIYTSGTTADPKGAMLCHDGIIKSSMGVAIHYKLPIKSMLVLPLHHTFGMGGGVILPMLNGGNVFINSSVRKLVPDMQHSKPNYICAVPLMVEMAYKKVWEGVEKKGKTAALKKLIKISNILLKLGVDIRRKAFSSVHEVFGGEMMLWIIGGAPIDRDVVRGYHNFGIEAHVGFGTTECSPFVAGGIEHIYSPDSSGTAVAGVEMRIVDGELQVKGPNVFLGYYKDPEASIECFDGEWFKTGDLGEIVDDYLYITGRKKNVIILSNGKNISPEELEQLLQKNISEIVEVVVYGENGKLTAEIFLGEEPKASEEEIKKAIFDTNRSLPVYKQVANIKFRNTEFPKTTTKKIMRRAIEIGGKNNA